MVSYSFQRQHLKTMLKQSHHLIIVLLCRAETASLHSFHSGHDNKTPNDYHRALLLNGKTEFEFNDDHHEVTNAFVLDAEKRIAMTNQKLEGLYKVLQNVSSTGNIQ